jgi:cell division protein FtsW
LIEGERIKGAQRWFYIAGFSFQPSEVCKPLFVIFNAWILTLWIEKSMSPGWVWSIASIIIISTLLLLQPDLGMTIIMIFTWGFQLFITGIPVMIICLLILAFPIFMIFSYQNFDHVKIRIDNFIEGKTYQVSKSLQSFESGGFWGKGPGEGFYKKSLPDAHSDFVFAVASGKDFL